MSGYAIHKRLLPLVSSFNVIHEPKSIPNMKKLNKNLCPLALFFWKIFICTTAPIMNKTMNTVWAGISTFFAGAPPRAHTMGGYGGFMFA
jgi:hypothetical protein